MSGKLLLVEGGDDKQFVIAALKHFGILDVHVKPPGDVNLTGGWTGVLKYLEMQLDLAKGDDAPDRLGVVLDADYPSNQGGFSQRFTRVEQLLSQAGYLLNQVSCPRGSLFSHPGGLPPIGLWVMPNHADDGSLEEFLTQLITSEVQLKLLSHAGDAIASLPKTLFDPVLRRQKALVSTWRAWQKYPGAPYKQCVDDAAFDMSSALAGDFYLWLKLVFTDSLPKQAG